MCIHMYGFQGYNKRIWKNKSIHDQNYVFENKEEQIIVEEFLLIITNSQRDWVIYIAAFICMFKHNIFY